MEYKKLITATDMIGKQRKAKQRKEYYEKVIIKVQNKSVSFSKWKV